MSPQERDDLIALVQGHLLLRAQLRQRARERIQAILDEDWFTLDEVFPFQEPKPMPAVVVKKRTVRKKRLPLKSPKP